MQTWAMFGVIISALTLAATIMTHLIKTAEFWGKLITRLDTLEINVQNIVNTVMEYKSHGYTKAESAKDLAYINRDIQAIWKRIDELKKS